MEVPPHEPLSPLQLGMISDYVKDFHPALDLMQVLCDTKEDLVPSTFAQAWNVLANRHDLLRSRFLWEGVDVPVREILDSVSVPFAEHDWRDLSTKAQEAQLEKFLEEDRQAGLALTQAPLMRVTLFRTGRRRWRWCLTCHHLLIDGRALLQVLMEVSAVYESLRSGAPVALPPAPAYGDYVAWHQRQDWSSAEKWWRAHLAGFTQPTPLIESCGAGLAGDEAWDEHKVDLSSKVTRRLGALAKQADVTLNILLQGAWALFLSRCSGEQEVMFGAIRACRKSNVPTAPSTVGLFMNTLPMRVRMDAEQELFPWLKELRKQWSELRAFENVPLPQVQGWSEVPRGTRLFDSIFNYEEPSWDKALASQGGVWRRRHFWHLSHPSYPLTMDIYGGGPSLTLNMVYDRRRFSADTISRMMEHFQMLLESLVAAGATQRLGEVEMLTKATRRLVVEKWNDTSRRYPRKGIHELFEEQARRTPDAVAVTCGGESITYHKLNLRANRLGRHLRSHGAGQGALVAICAERSLELIVGLLGILKAGAAYVPLDPEYPEERLVFMLKDTGAPLLLTQSHLASRLPVSAAKMLLLDTDWPEIKRQSSDGFSSGTDGKSPSHVIYTSGSSGTPKGVVIPHEGVVRLVVNTNYVNITPDDVVLQVAAVSFDASTFEIWGALLNGARLMVHPPGRYALEDLAEFIATHRISATLVTTALFEQLVEFHSGSLTCVRQLLTGGETMPLGAMRKALRDLPGTRIIHCYGPTENSTVTTSMTVETLAEGARSVSIGRPIANTTVYILDARLQPVPPGVPGELYTGGDGLALGYLNRPELTAERFIKHPFRRGDGERLYRTGDMARWLPDGTVDFMGRLDHQVKIRGHRIELGEIEAVLGEHPEVRDAVVVAREDAPGNKRLIAFMSLRQALPIREVRRFLEGRMPSYMIPSVFVPLESFPLTANGKVDRRALPDPRLMGGNGDGGVQHVPPRTETEEIVAAIWSEALEVPLVGVHDHFFELGGHSLRAMMVVSRLRKVLGKSVPVRLLFENPVLESFCSVLQQFRLDRGLETVQPIVRMPRKDPLPASSFQERIWLNYLQRKEGSPVNLYLPFQLKGPLVVSALESSLNEIVRRYEVLRTRVRMHEGKAVQFIAPVAPVTLEVVPMSGVLKLNEELLNLVSRIVDSSLDEGNGPVVRFVLLRWSPVMHLFLVILHPLAYDASVRLNLFRELDLLYAANSEGRQVSLPEPALQYADLAMWQRGWLVPGTPALRLLIDYWTRQLEGELRPVTLPFARSSPPPAHPEKGVADVYVTRPTVSKMARFAREQGATQFMFLLACVKVILHLRTRQTDILVGTYFGGQSRPELADIMGPQTNLVPLRTDFAGNPSFAEVLKRVREVVLEAQAHQDLPFEELVAALSSAGKPPPPIEAIFMHTHYQRPVIRLKGLRTKVSRVTSPQAAWGLSINFLSRDEDPNFLTGTCVFDTNLHEPAAVQAMMNSIPDLIERLMAHAHVPLDELTRAG